MFFQAVGGVEHVKGIGTLKRRAFPQLRGRADASGGPVPLVGAHRGALLQQGFETFGVDVAGVDGDPAAVRSGDEAFGAAGAGR